MVFSNTRNQVQTAEPANQEITRKQVLDESMSNASRSAGSQDDKLLDQKFTTILASSPNDVVQTKDLNDFKVELQVNNKEMVTDKSRNSRVLSRLSPH